jgi:hypothetical protein
MVTSAGALGTETMTAMRDTVDCDASISGESLRITLEPVPPIEPYHALPRLAPSTIPASAIQGVETATVPPVVITEVPPPLPDAIARGRSVNVTGLLEIVVSARGDVGYVTVLRSIHPAYDQLLIAQARRWRYLPATRDGKAVAYVKRVAVILTAR